MKKEEIIEGNKLIAEFLNGKYPYPNDNRVLTNEFTSVHIDDLKYHSSWDWLMPVVEKISKEHNISLSSTDDLWAFYINRKDSDSSDSIADFGGFEPMILNVWKCVVAYIKWRNKQPKYK